MKSLKLKTSFNADMSLFEKHAGTFGKIGNEFLKQSGLISPTNIKLARDGGSGCGKICGHRLGFQIQTMGRCKIGRQFE
ncbi:hypothetical protein OHP003_08100 [Helicobacter pylori]|nr:hypothetical protein OHP003_08100 [Helicobacter pylori]